MFQEGDVVEIPLPDGRTAIGRILHISERYKDCMGFIVCGIKGEVRNPNFKENPVLEVILLYTTVPAAEHYGWKTIQQIPLKPRDRELTRRQVGGNVYVGDEFLGTVGELGEHGSRRMLVSGMLAVYKHIAKAFPSATE